jgi:hypothetical protein
MKRRGFITLVGGRGSVATGGGKLGETSASPLNHLRRPCRAAPA